MSVQFHVLASGSSGNACVLDVGGFGVLLDFGLSPRQLAPRMQRARISWDRIHAAVLTHTHTDHWQSSTLAHLAKLRLPVYCHEEHLASFDPASRAVSALSSAGLIRHYEHGKRWALHPDCECTPISLPHDAAKTCGFRFEGRSWAIGYAADLGSWKSEIVRQLSDVDLLALEFNHDVAMQVKSGRHPTLIRRVLGDSGHLSNDQAAALFSEILKRSEPNRLKYLVQLHLSQECNRPELAQAAASRVLERVGIEMAIRTAVQGKAGPTIRLGQAATKSRRRAGRAEPAFSQPLLPFGRDGE
ncbi:MAG: MBL fold metallo-hydrolase [Gemmataceae bacterium]|nr:MBL fold metallo-hydrolase [Gemmataceae bacterium]